MSSSPPPVVKKPRPKPKPRHAAPPSDTNQLSVSSEGRAGGAGAGPSRSPSLPGSQGRLLSSSSKTPASRTPSAATPISIASSPEPQAIAVPSQKKEEKQPSEPAVRRSSRPTNSFLKRDVDVDAAAAAAQPTWVTADDEDEDGEEEIDELEPSSLESAASGKGKGKGKGKGRSIVDEEKEEEERRIKERQDEDERRFNAQFQRKPRGWLDKDGLHKNKEIAKGKGKASSKSRSPGRGTSAQVISDSDDEMAAFDKQRSASDDDDDSEDGGVGRASKKRNRAPAGTQKKRKLVHDWSVKDTMSESSESDSDVRVVGGKTKKANVRGGGGETKPAAAAAREKSASLTPPPELDPMILLRVNNQVRSALADDHPNPLLERDGQASESDDDDDFGFNVPAPRQPSPPPAHHVNARAGPSRANFSSNAPIVLDDSDDEVSASPAPTQAPVRQRNAKTFDAPMSVKIKVKVISHHDRTKVSERAVAQFEKKKVYHRDRFDTLGSVFDEVAADCGYPAADLVMTNDSKRIYRSTMVDTLGIYDEALFIGYRKDIYEAEIKRKKDEEEARLARLALEAASQEDPNDGGGGEGGSDSDDSSNNNNNNNNNAPSPPPLPPTEDNNANARRSHSAAPAAGGEGETKLRLTLRGPHGEAKFMVKTTTKISSLIKNYGSKRALAKEVWEKLRVEDPDGEMMDNEKTVGDYEVEDDDMLSVT